MTTFEPPGRGEWRSFAEHFPNAMPPYYERLISETLEAGMSIGFERYGLPVRTVELRCVHGHAYLHPAPLLDDRGRALPPAPVLWLAARLHPVFRRRERAARAALAARLWRDDTTQWFGRDRAEWVERNRRVQAVDPASLDAAALADHLGTVLEHARAGYQKHFELHAADMLPAGLLLARAADWKLDQRLLSTALAGASPVSRGENAQLDALRRAVERAGAAPATLDDIRALGPDVAAMLDEYLEEYGCRLVSSYDATGATLGELPALVLARILVASRTAIEPSVVQATETILRLAVPEAERAEFDSLLDEARATCALRDDNGQLTASWPMGLLRRALLEAGDRLVAHDRLLIRDDVMELEIEETRGLLLGERAPSAGDAAARRVQRAANTALVAPSRLGTPDPLPPWNVLPRGLATLGRALMATVEGLETVIDVADGTLRGSGIGRELYRGRAVVARQPEEAIERLEPGDVLVASFTTPAYNAVLPLAGALVVEAGGYLSHAAVMARELDLPAVIGATGAMTEIGDGDTVEVDPVNGVVRVASVAVPAQSPA